MGLVQGLTEFLPVSSSGHLVIGEALLGVEGEPDVLFEVLVHFGTLLAILVVFRDRIWALMRAVFEAGPDRVLLGAVVVGTIPAAVLGILFEDQLEALFSSVPAVSIALLVTGCILHFARQADEVDTEVDLLRGVWIGIAQAFAIIPGISRSGTTIALGLRLGLDQRRAAEFSFLLAIPAIGGATVLKVTEAILVPSSTSVPWGPYFAGMVVAALSGWLALRWLLDLLGRGRFHVFRWYCWFVGASGLGWAWLA